MKNKPLLYGLIGGMALALYFRFGKKSPSNIAQTSDLKTSDLPEKIKTEDQINAPSLSDKSRFEDQSQVEKMITINGNPIGILPSQKQIAIM